MSHSLDTLVESVLAALRTAEINGLLLEADAVRLGRYIRPPRVPFVAVSAPTIASKPGPVLTQWEHRVSLDVVAFVPAPPDLDGRVRAGMAALHGLHDAVELAMNKRGDPLYGVPDAAISASAIDSDLDGSPTSAAVVGLVIEFTLHRRSGLSS